MTSVLREVPENLRFYVIDSSYCIIAGDSSSNHAFYNSKNTLVGFKFSDNNPKLVEIQKFAFHGCRKLEVINLSSATQLRTIGNNAFTACINVKQLMLPKGVNDIGSYAFSNNEKLNLISLSSSLKVIGSQLFENCYSLETIEFEPGIQIEKIPGLFIRNTKVRKITVPKNVSSTDTNAFEQCSTLERIGFNSLVSFPANHSVEYTVKEQCTEIQNDAFAFANIERVTIPNSVKKISTYAFRGTNIASIKLPDELESVDSYLFYESRHLSHVELPLSVVRLSQYAFAGCNLTEFVIPSNVTFIGAFCFADNILLYNVTLSENIEQLEGGIFSNCSRNIQITIPKKSKFDIIDKTLMVDKTHENVYQYFGSEESVVIPKTANTIKSGAFYQCASLVSVILEDGSKLTRIEDKVFMKCSNLATFPFENIHWK